MIQILLIALCSLLIQFLLPWWSLAIVAFLVCFWRGRSASRSFLYGFTGIALVWLVYALLIHFDTGGAFTIRMSQLLFKSGSAALPLLVTAILGGLVGGMAGLSGFYVRRATGNQIANHSS